MIRIRKVYCVIVVTGLLLSSVAAQQDRSKLEKEKRKLENEISYTNKLIEETSKSKNATLSQLKFLNNNIKGREKLILNVSREIESIEGNLTTIGQEINVNDKTIGDLKKEYKQMVIAYEKQRKSSNMLMFVFASESFNQAYKRIRYFKQFQDYRKLQIKKILNLQNQLIINKKAYVSEKEQKRNLKLKEEVEKKRLLAEKQKSNRSYQNLTKQEKQLKKTLDEKKAAAQKLTKAIEKAIEDEAKKSIARSTTPKTSSGSKYANLMSAEEVKLSQGFSENKGRLPWPLNQGVISESFGDHAHAVLKNVTVRNNGINISTQKDQTVKCIFEGVVTTTMYIAGFQNTVIVRHGEYLTVYSNLKNISVKQGDKLKTGQKVGVVGDDQDGSNGELHFELWKGKTQQNPGLWLAGE